MPWRAGASWIDFQQSVFRILYFMAAQTFFCGKRSHGKNMDIRFENLKAETASFNLEIDHWIIQENQSWGVFNTDGDVGSLIGDLLCQEVTEATGSVQRSPGTVAQVSLAEQQRLLEQEIANDDTDFQQQYINNESSPKIYETSF